MTKQTLYMKSPTFYAGIASQYKIACKLCNNAQVTQIQAVKKISNKHDRQSCKGIQFCFVFHIFKLNRYAYTK